MGEEMEDLGQLEDLPKNYRVQLVARSLVPLWPSQRAAPSRSVGLPEAARSQTQLPGAARARRRCSRPVD